jgi:hypothetical protein
MRRLIKSAAILFAAIFLASPMSSGQVRRNVIDAIADNFVTYCKLVPREEVYVHTDRQKYIAGESMWFTAYVVDRQSNQPSSLSNIIYLEIINPDNQRVASMRVNSQDGRGPGQVIIPDTLSSGTYTLRAYTNWMRNFMPVNCFTKHIDVYNALENKNFRHRVVPETSYPIPPEAGSGTPSIVISKNDPGNLKLTFCTGQQYLYSNGNQCYIFIQTRGNINYTGSFRITGDSTVIFVPRQDISAGINQITVFNAEGDPVLEKYIYTPRDENRVLSMNLPDKAGIRQHVTIDLGMSGKAAQDGDYGMMSISISPAEAASTGNIYDYMTFGSEFGMLPDKFIDSLEIMAQSGELEKNLLSFRSNWIDWKAIKSGVKPVFTYQPEKESHFLYGTLVDLQSGKAAPGEYIFLSKPGKVAAFQYAVTDEKGLFKFELPISGMLQDIVIQPEKTDKKFKIRLESPFYDSNTSAIKNQVGASEETNEKISEWSENYQVNKIYNITALSDSAEPVKPLQPFTRFYGKPDAWVNMDDYIKLPVMQEVFFELLPGVLLKSHRSGYGFSMLNLVENHMNIKDPSLFIDGVVVNDASLIANLDPELVERIDVVKEPYLVGRYIFCGIINVITRKGDFSCINLPDYAIRLPFRVTDPVFSFKSPEYSEVVKKQSNIPDFRNTIYWNPSVIPGKDGRLTLDFWTSDCSSDYEINVQGIDEKGGFVSFRKTLKVETSKRP